MANYYANFLNVNGIFDGTVNFPQGVINRHSHVMASICEMDPEEYPPEGFPFKGAAVFTLHNVVPSDTGHVTLTIDTGWTESLINARVFFVIDPA